MASRSPEEGLSSALSKVGRGFDEPLLVARWCAKLLAQPPAAGYSDEDRARVYAILVRNLDEVQSLLNNLRGVATSLSSLGSVTTPTSDPKRPGAR